MGKCLKMFGFWSKKPKNEREEERTILRNSHFATEDVHTIDIRNPATFPQNRDTFSEEIDGFSVLGVSIQIKGTRLKHNMEMSFVRML